jgi:hypothetical protein
MFQASTLVNAAQQLKEPDKARILRTLAQLPGVIDVLERRRMAGTLLFGKCAPHEVEWARRLARKVLDGTDDASTTAAWAQHIGYDVYLKAARLALLDLHYRHEVFPTEEQKPEVVSFVISALYLMCAPRPIEDVPSYAEATLLETVRYVLGSATLCRVHHDALRAAYRRLLASGAIARRRMEVTAQIHTAHCLEADAKAHADNAARGLQSCAHCGAREVHVAQFKRCSACKTVVFCCKECQLANWPAHKTACKAARKAAAGAAAGS